MKKVLHIVTATLFIVFVSLLSSSCSEGISQTTNNFTVSDSKSDPTSEFILVYSLIDVTASAKNQEHGMNLTTKQLRRLFDLDSNPKKKVSYYQSLITETHLNKVFSAHLPSASPNGYNKFKRAHKIKMFMSEIDTALQELNHVKYGRQTSSIFIPVAQTINKIARTNADKQVLLLNSDLFENTFILSKYDKAQMKKIANAPKSLEEILDRETPVNHRLDKMTIYIVHQPDIETDEDFYIISQIYKNWLEQKGAHVEITANLTF